MSHDQYYAVLTDAPALAKELDKYIQHIEQCMEEDCDFGTMADLCLQLEDAKKVREHIRRIFDE